MTDFNCKIRAFKYLQPTYVANNDENDRKETCMSKVVTFERREIFNPYGTRVADKALSLFLEETQAQQWSVEWVVVVFCDH